MAKPHALPLMAQDLKGQQQDGQHQECNQHTHVRPQGAAAVLASSCYMFGAVSLAASLLTVWLYGGVWDFSPSYAKEEMAEHFENGIMMLIPAIMLEGAQVLSSSRAGARLEGYDFRKAVAIQFGVKFCCYTTLWGFQGGIVHRNLRSPDARPVYSVRYIDWTLAVPALVAMNSFIFDSDVWPLKLERITSLLWGAFCFPVACWVGQITPSASAGWVLIALSLVGYILQSAQQAVLVHERRAHTRQAKFKITAFLFLELYTACYGVVMLLGNVGLISSLSEQMFFTYADVLLKTMQAAALLMIRNWEELERVEATLRNEVDRGKEDMANLFKRASVPIVCLSNEGVVLGWNQQMADLTSIREEVAQGELLTNFVAQECRKALESAIQACNSNESTGTVELRLTLPEQPEATVSTVTMNFIAQMGTDADSGSIVGVGQDLTELVASKELQERRARFAAVVSHELRSPLHGITGLSRAMAETAASDIEKKQLGMINGCANRLLDLVSNIMDQSAVDKESEAGLERQVQVNLLDILDEVTSMMRGAVDKSGKKMLKNNVDLINNMTMQSFPVVVGDPYKCTQLFYNLVVNACKFTKEGSVAVSARRCGGFVEIDVEDTGCGIAPDALARIFNPFEQETSSDSRSFQGIGLGLSVARGIVKLHQGEITVKSEKGVGSTFTVRLPCEKEEVSRQYPAEERPAADPSSRLKAGRSPAQQEGPVSGSSVQQGPAKGLPGCAEQEKVACQVSHQVGSIPTMSDVTSELSRHLTLSALPAFSPGVQPLVLSVDDDEVNHCVIERHLGQKYRMVKAMDGMEAIEYLKSNKERPTMVLLDIMMPGMTGFDVVKEIRTTLNMGQLTLPVIMLSARSPPEETMLQAFQNGATDYLAKPFSFKLLQQRMSVHLNVRRDTYSLCSLALKESRCDEDDVELGQAKEDILSLQDELTRLSSEADSRLEKVRQEMESKHAAKLEAEKARMEELQSELAQTQADAAAAGAERARAEKLQSELAQTQADAAAAGAERARAEKLQSELAQTRTEVAALRAQMQQLQSRKVDSVMENTWTSLSESSMGDCGGRALDPLGAYREPACGPSSSIAREARWLRHELELAQETVAQLSADLARREAEAWLQQHNSSCASREAFFLKEELSRARGFMEASADCFIMD